MGACTRKNGLILTYWQKPEERFRANLHLRETNLFGWAKMHVHMYQSICCWRHRLVVDALMNRRWADAVLTDGWMDGSNFTIIGVFRMCATCEVVDKCTRANILFTSHTCFWRIMLLFPRRYLTFSFSMIGHISSTVQIPVYQMSTSARFAEWVMLRTMWANNIRSLNTSNDNRDRFQKNLLW